MRFGLYLPTEGDFADVALLASLARDAEAAGWDGFFVWDELLPIFEHSDPVRTAVGDSGHVADAMLALTAVAAATDRIRFGALVTPVARLRPESFAKQTATLDRFSGGRLVVGVGLGNPVDQFVAFGGEADPRVRAAMVDEFLDLLARLWSGERVDFDGAHYSARGVILSPSPLQRPRIPIWIGGDSGHRRPRRRAARWDGYVPASETWPDGVISVEEYEVIVADISAHRSPDGGEFDVVVIGNAAGTLPSAESIDAYAAVGVTWVLEQALTVTAAQERIQRGPPGFPAY